MMEMSLQEAVDFLSLRDLAFMYIRNINEVETDVSYTFHDLIKAFDMQNTIVLKVNVCMTYVDTATYILTVECK